MEPAVKVVPVIFSCPRQNCLPTSRHRARLCLSILIFSVQLLHITLLNLARLTKISIEKFLFHHFPTSRHLNTAELALLLVEQSLVLSPLSMHCNVRPDWHGMQVRGICTNFIANQTFNIRHPLHLGVSRGGRAGPLPLPACTAAL